MTGTPLPWTFSQQGKLHWLNEQRQPLQPQMQLTMRQPQCAALRVIMVLVLCGFAAVSSAQSSQTRQQSTQAVTRSASPSPDKKVVEIQGHRGCRGLMPENTIPGFLYAMELGVTVLELDVCISADGQVVVSHEPWINPEICQPGPGGVQNEAQGFGETPAETSEEDSERGKLLHFGRLTYADISRYDCGSLRPSRFPEQQNQAAVKPLLSDVLRQTDARARETGQSIAYNIELKAKPAWDGVEQPGPEVALPLLLAVMKESDAWLRWHLQSFDYRVLRLARSLEPTVPLVQLVEENPSMQLELKRLGFEPAVYSPWFKLVTPALVKKAHKRGIRVIPWTVNEAADMQRLVDMGVDGLITDYPDRAFALP